jgi:hypothetical protein
MTGRFCAPEAWLPDWIIEEELKRERREREERERPQPYLELPLPPPEMPAEAEKPASDRGVVIIPL